MTGASILPAAAAESLDAVDLSALDEIVSPRREETVWSDVSPVPVGLRDTDEPRFYLTGLLGASFATLDDPVHDSLREETSINRTVLTAGGAAGMAYARENGQLRVEFEGRGRDDLTRHWSVAEPEVAADFSWAASDGWSTMANVWRDFAINERWLVYAGGGIGAGGYRYSLDGDVAVGPVFLVGYRSDVQVAAFAWQIGGGAVYNVTERVALDVGYRFFAIDQADATYSLRIAGDVVARTIQPQQFTASELLFGLRIYEPFRRWQ
jgi:opacity protein-like surface antigen